MTDPRLIALQELYDQLPTINCQGKCANSCGAIDLSHAERERIIDLGVVIPRFTPEWVKRWNNNEQVHCPALNRQTLRCDVYEARPMICRLWGLGPDLMSCPHGCEPSKRLTLAELYTFLLTSLRIGGSDAYESQEEIDHFLAMLEDEEIGPLIARFVNGDRTVEPELVETLNRRSGRAG